MRGYIWPMSDCLGWFVVYVRVVQNYIFVVYYEMYKVFGKEGMLHVL